MMSSRELILRRLKSHPAGSLPGPVERRAMVPEPADLCAAFVEQAQKLSCIVHRCEDAVDTLDRLLSIIGEDRRILSWDPHCIPLAGLADVLREAGIEIAPSHDASVRVGVTGVDAAVAGTGSLILASGPGKARLVSLLPFVHVAVVTEDQLVPNFEAWAARQRAAGLAGFRQASHTTVISGPSRTADIAMELVLGAHGPAEVQLLLCVAGA